MSHRDKGGPRRRDEELNRGDYRGDFGGEGYHRFDSPPGDRGRQHHEGTSGRSSRPGRDDHHDRENHGGAPTAGPWEWGRRGREGWQRGRVGGGFGSEYDGWRQGAGVSRGGFDDHDWQPTRPARGRGAWAGDWENEGAARRDAQGDYRGRGPRGYRRSDDSIRDEACERLTDDPSVDATEVSLQVSEGEVTLTGTVSSREQKRRAEECVERIRGVHDVINQLRVRRDEGSGGGGTAPSRGGVATDRGRR